MKNSVKIDPYGFREYDARWLYEKNINLLGIETLEYGLKNNELTQEDYKKIQKYLKADSE